MKVIFRSFIVLLVMCFLVGFVFVVKHSSSLINARNSISKRVIPKEIKNKSQSIAHENNIDDKHILQVLDSERIKLTKSKLKLEDKYILNGVKPTIYDFNKVKNQYLYIYVFKSLYDREQAASWNSILLNNRLANNDLGIYTAKNVLLILRQTDNKSLQSIRRRQLFEETIFYKLNNAKEIVFTGEGNYWQATYKVRYFEYFMEDSDGKLSYDNFAFVDGELTYKGADVSKVGKVDYIYDRGAGTGFTLNKEGKTRFARGGGNGSVFMTDQVIQFHVLWDGKEEKFILKNDF